MAVQTFKESKKVAGVSSCFIYFHVQNRKCFKTHFIYFCFPFSSSSHYSISLTAGFLLLFLHFIAGPQSLIFATIHVLFISFHLKTL